MSSRRAVVEARIATAGKLAAVIGAMRGIAAARVREADGSLDGIRTYAATIGAAIARALTLLPGDAAARVPGAATAPASRDAEQRAAPRDADPRAAPRDPQQPAAPRDRDRTAVVLLAAEQGFAGAFSVRVFDAAAPLLARRHVLILAGDRGLPLAAERGIAVNWSAPMIAHPGETAGLAARISEAVYARLAEGDVTRVDIVHALPVGPTGAQVVTRTLVPFDYGRFPAPGHGVAPRLTLPPEDLLARLAEEYVFAEIAEAVMLSFAAENAARMRAMIAAHDNVTRSLDDLTHEARRLRQEDITAVVAELATAGRPVG